MRFGSYKTGPSSCAKPYAVRKRKKKHKHKAEKTDKSQNNREGRRKNPLKGNVGKTGKPTAGSVL